MTHKPENGPPPELLYVTPKVWRGFLVCMAILAALLLAVLMAGCTAPQQDSAAAYARAIEQAARLSSEARAQEHPVESDALQEALLALGAGAGAVVAALGAWKSHTHAKAAKASAESTVNGS